MPLASLIAVYAAGSVDARACTACDAAMVCESSGVTLGNVALVPHAWRLSNATSAVLTCGDDSNVSSCTGGDDPGAGGAGYCAAGFEGPRCEWCSDDALYFRSSDSTCQPCGDVASFALQRALLLLGACAAVGALLLLLRLALRRRLERLKQLWIRLRFAVRLPYDLPAHTW